MKKPIRWNFLAGLMIVLVSATAGLILSHSKPTTTQDLSSTQESTIAAEATEINSTNLSEINTRFEQNILKLKQMKSYEERKKAGEELLNQLMQDLSKNSDSVNDIAFRLVDMVQIVRNALTTKCSNVTAVTKFLAITESQAIQMINGPNASPFVVNHKEQNERKAYNILLCNP